MYEEDDPILAEDIILARRSAAFAIRRYPNTSYKEDIYGAAYLGMVQGRNSAPEGDLRIPYVVKAIQRSIMSMLEGVNMIRIPKRSKDRNADKAYPMVKADAYETVEDYPDKEQGLEIGDLPLTADERKVVEMLLAGYKEVEIAASLGVSRIEMYRRRAATKAKVRNFLN